MISKIYFSRIKSIGVGSGDAHALWCGVGCLLPYPPPPSLQSIFYSEATFYSLRWSSLMPLKYDTIWPSVYKNIIIATGGSGSRGDGSAGLSERIRLVLIFINIIRTVESFNVTHFVASTLRRSVWVCNIDFHHDL